MYGWRGRREIAALEKVNTRLEAKVEALSDQLAKSNSVEIKTVVFNVSEEDRRLECDLRELMGRIGMSPFGDDGTRYGELPDGTRIVERPDGGIGIALPVRIAGKLEITGDRSE